MNVNSMHSINLSHFDYHFSSDKKLMQWKVIHAWLCNESYWAKNIPFELVKAAGENSFCIGVFYENIQIGYARIITDYNTFGYLADVFIVAGYRKKGLSKIMMSQIMQLDWVKKLRRFMLATLDAHDLYRQYGFVNPKKPDRLMEINQSGIYEKQNQNNY